MAVFRIILVMYFRPPGQVEKNLLVREDCKCLNTFLSYFQTYRDIFRGVKLLELHATCNRYKNLQNIVFVPVNGVIPTMRYAYGYDVEIFRKWA